MNSLILFALFTPAIGALFVAIAGGTFSNLFRKEAGPTVERANLREGVTALFSFTTLGLVVALAIFVAKGARPSVVLFEFVPGVPLAFTIEPLGALYALVAAGLWPLTSSYAAGYLRAHHEQNQTRFFICFALAIFAALGIAFAANLGTLFLFYEVLTLSTYPLVTHSQTAGARRAGRVYLGILLTTSVVFLLFAIVWTYFATGTLTFTPGGILAGKIDDASLPILLGLFAFGAGKAALMPFHRWLPNAMVAPTPVSALLHAVAVVKAGVFTILKVVIYIFGLDLLANTGASEWLMALAAFSVLMGSLIAFRQDNLKARLAYSTIAQLAYITLGAALVTPDAFLGGALHILTHAVGKITLFFCAGAIIVFAHETRVSQLDGLGKKMPLTMFAFFVASLSIIGLPPTGGTWSKWLLATGSLRQDGVDHHVIYIGVLMLSSLLNIGYLIPISIRAFFFKPNHELHAQEANVACLVPLLTTTMLCVVLFFFCGTIVEFLSPVLDTSPWALDTLGETQFTEVP